MKVAFAIALLLCACAHSSPSRTAGLAKWQADHPQAAGQVCAFNQQYPGMSTRVREWILDHPIQARELLEWGAANPDSPMPEMFLQTRLGSGRRLDPAIYVLFDWATSNPAAAQALADDPGELRAAFGAGVC